LANVRINYTVDKKQVDAADKALTNLNKTTDVSVKETDQLNKKFKDTDKEAASVSTSVLGLNGQLTTLANKFNVAGVGLGTLAQGFGATTKGIFSASGALKVFRGALIATGIGAFVVAIGALVAALTNSEAAQNRLSKIMSAFGVVVGNITDRLEAFGEVIIDAFSNPQKTIENLGKSIIRFVTNPIDSIINGAKAAKDAVVDFAKESQNEVKQSIALSDREAALRLKRREALIAEKTLQQQISQFTRDSRDEEAFTIAQRLSFAEKAIALETELANTQTEVAAEELSIARARAELNNNKIDDNEELIRLEGELIDIQTRKAQGEQTSLRVLTTLRKQQLAETKNLTKAFKAQTDEIVESINEINKAQQEAGIKDSLVPNVGNIQKAIAKIVELTKKAGEELDAEEQERQDNKEKLISESIGGALALADSIVGIAYNSSQKQITILEQQKAAELKIAGNDIAAREAIEIRFNDQIADEQRKQAQREKLLSLFNIGVNTATAIVKSLPNIPLSIIAGAVGAAQAAVVASTPIPFNKGTKRVPGGDTSRDSVHAILTPGEGVMPVDRMNAYRPAFEAMFDRKINPDVLNSFVKNGGSQVLVNNDMSQIAKAIKGQNRKTVVMDKTGFTGHIISETQKVRTKANKYSW
jgi:hypothetical protein